MTNVQAKHRAKWLRKLTRAEFHLWLVHASYTAVVLVAGFVLGHVYR